MIRTFLRASDYILMCNNMDTAVRRLLAPTLSSDQLSPTCITDSYPNTSNVRPVLQGFQETLYRTGLHHQEENVVTHFDCKLTVNYL